MNQRTITREASISGIGVNSGQAVTLTLRPASPGQGIIFRRTDLPGSPEIQASILAVSNLVRRTAISSGSAEAHLVEHVLSAIHGCGIDNVYVDLSAPEAPIMDGSAKAFAELILFTGILEQPAEKTYYRITRPIVAQKGSASVLGLPHDEFRVTYTAMDDRALFHSQHASFTITPETYVREIAPARTYILRQDAEALRAAGGIKGGTLENCIVLDGEQYLCAEPLRFPDELVRHKILDFVGDIMLLGMPVRGHFVISRAGHALHAEFTKILSEEIRTKSQPASV